MLVPGVERTWDGYHVCGLGVSDWVDAPDLESWADRIRAAGGLVSMAHPARYRHRVPARVLEVSDAVEIWNAKRPYDGMVGPHPRAFDLLGAARIGLAAQDVHRWSDFNSVGVVVRDVGSTEDVVAAIRTGSLHLSSALLTVRGRPGRATAIALAGVHAARPVAWALRSASTGCCGECGGGPGRRRRADPCGDALVSVPLPLGGAADHQRPVGQDPERTAVSHGGAMSHSARRRRPAVAPLDSQPSAAFANGKPTGSNAASSYRRLRHAGPRRAGRSDGRLEPSLGRTPSGTRASRTS